MQLPDLVASMFVYLKRNMSIYPENDLTTDRELHGQRQKKANPNSTDDMTQKGNTANADFDEKNFRG